MATITTKTAKELPKDQSPEETPGRVANPPGVYEHKAASAAHGRPIQLIVLPDPHTNAQADALVRMGYEWVGPPPSRVEIAKMQADQLKADLEAEKKGLDTTAASNPEAPNFNGSGDTQSSADKDAALSAAQRELDSLRARAEAAEAALAEAVTQEPSETAEPAQEPAAPAEGEAPAGGEKPETDQTNAEGK